MVFSPTVGSGGVGTAYQSANQLPNVLFEVAAGGALAGAIVPLLAGPIARGAAHEASKIASALLTWTITLLLPLSALLALLAGPLTNALVPGNQVPGTVALSTRLLIVFAPQVVLYGIGVVLTGVLQAHRRFLWPAFVPLLSSAVVMAAYIIYNQVSGGTSPPPSHITPAAEAWLGWGTTAGVVAISLPLFLPARATGIRFRPTWKFPAGVARRAAHLAGAGIVTLLAQQIAVLTTLKLANAAGGTGAYVVFAYNQAVYLLPYAVLLVPLATSAFPRLSELAARRDSAGFSHAAARTTRVVTLAAGLGTAVLAAAAPGIGSLFANIDATRGDTGAAAPPFEAMPVALVIMAIGLWGWGMVAHLSRALYSLERGRASAAATASGWGVVIVVTIAVVPILAAANPSNAGDVTLIGLAIGNSAGMLVAGVLLMLAIRRAVGPAGLEGNGRAIAAAACAAVVGGAVGYVVDGWLLGEFAGMSPAVAAVASGCLGAVCAVVLGLAAVVLLDRGSVRALRSIR
nr:lipid II flippase MurJ [Spelaeicoccus albus]